MLFYFIDYTQVSTRRAHNNKQRERERESEEKKNISPDNLSFSSFYLFFQSSFNQI
jgi:hypothetical protein